MITPFFEFNPTEEAVFAKLSADFASSVESAKKPVQPDYITLLAMAKEICARHGVRLAGARQEVIAQAAFHSFAGFGCLDFLLSRDDLEEISFVGTDRPVYAFSKSKGMWVETNCFLCSDRFGQGLVNKMAQKSGKRLSFATPRLDASLESGARLHATCPPISPAGVSFSIRIFPKNKLSLAGLVASKSLSAEASAFLWFAMQSDCSILVAGNTGGGKTTLLNALADFVGLHERVVVLEDTAELVFSQRHVARLVAAKTPMRELIKDTLRMRPDRVFVGEVRAAEDCKALFDCLLSGQARGTYATFHADSGQECLDRLRLMGAQESDLAALDLVAVVRRIPVYDTVLRTSVEKRRVTEICEIACQSGRATARQVFSFDHVSDSLEFCGFSESRLRKKVFQSLSNIKDEDFKKEWKRRSGFLRLPGNKEELAAKAHEYLYG